MKSELIKELLIKAGVYECDGNDPEFVVPEEQRKFAELIVKECAKVASHAENNDTEFRCMHEIITNHFGVE